MKKILVPTDFSEYALNALFVAFRLAKRFGAELLLVNAYNVPHSGASIMVSLDDIIRKDSEDGMAALVNRIKEIEEFKDVTFNTEIQHGALADVLLDVIKKENIDMVIMGTKGAGGVTGKLFGSNTSHMMNSIGVPLLVIPKHLSVDTIDEVVLATDLHLSSDSKVLRFLMELIDEFDSHLSLVNVRANIPVHTDEIIGQDLKELLSGVKHTFYVEENEDIFLGIESFLSKNKVDLLVVVPKEHKIMDRIFKKSVSTEITKSTDIPLLVIHEEEAKS